MQVASHNTPCPTTSSMSLYIAKTSSKRATRRVRMVTFAGREEDIKGLSDGKEETLIESGQKVDTIATLSDSTSSSVPIITADQNLQSRAAVRNSLAKDVEGGGSATSQIETKTIEARDKSTSSPMTLPISSTVPKTDISGEQGSFTSAKPSLSVREKLRTARTLSGFAESDKPGTPQRQKNLLDALRQSDKEGKTTKYGQPIEPSNLFDDRKRSTEKEQKFEFTWGPSQFYGLLSFVILTSIMFGTTYIVWKVGAIHYNDL